MNVTITITAVPELLSAINNITSVLTNTHSLKAPEEQAKKIEVRQDIKDDAQEAQKNPAPEKTENKTTIKPEDLRAVAATKDRQKVKNLLDNWGFASISAVDAADREAFLADLRGL